MKAVIEIDLLSVSGKKIDGSMENDDVRKAFEKVIIPIVDGMKKVLKKHKVEVAIKYLIE